MLKQLIKDVKNEAVRGSYINKVGHIGQKSIELSLLGYHLITPEKIEGFLRKTVRKLSGYKEITVNRLKVEESVSIECTGFDRDDDDVEFTYTLLEIPIENYSKLIPENCVDSIVKAKDTNFFDRFTVASPHCNTTKKDPVVFGRINGNPNRFYICQWDNDITLDDLL